MNIYSSGLTAAVLAGGFGTRLQPVIGEHAKVLANVCGRPFLGYVLDQLIDTGVRRAVLCVGYRAREVVDTFGDRYGPLRIEYSRERSPLGTAGALRRALPRLDSPSVIVLNGDSYFTGDLHELIRWHESHRASCSLALSHREDVQAFGAVQLAPGGGVQAFREKAVDCEPGWVNAGVYVMNRGFIAGIPLGQCVSLEKEILPACSGPHLMGYRSDGDFLDIGTPEGLARADAYFTNRYAPEPKVVGHGH